MVQIVSTIRLAEALKLEGYPLPDECSDVSLEMPVAGAMMLRYSVFVTTENLPKLGRALIRLCQPIGGHLPGCDWDEVHLRYNCVEGCPIKRINDGPRI